MRLFHEHKAVRIFLIICVAAILVSAFSFILDRENATYSLFFNQLRDNHMDFFNSVRDNATKNVYIYETGSIYPPLINWVYHLISRLFPGITEYQAIQVARTERGRIIYYSIQLIGVAVFLWGCWLNTKKLALWERICLLVVTLLSAPMLCVIERGNSLVYATALILLFIKSITLPEEKKVLRELGLIALAVAANIKFYPALFGVVLLKEKRYREAFRCALYGLILFVVPMFFYGGLEAMKNLFSSVRLTMGGLAGGVGYKIGWYNFEEIIRRAFGIPFPVDVDSFITALVLGGLLLCRSRSMVLLGLSLLCVGFPWFSYNYNGLYLFMPICCLLSDQADMSPNDGRRTDAVRSMMIPALLALAIVPVAVGGYAPFNEISIYYKDEWSQLNVTTLVNCMAVTLLGFVYFIAAMMDRDRMRVEDCRKR